MRRGSAEFALSASGIAAAAGVSILLGSAAAGVASPFPWGLAGWAVVAVPAVATGAWLAGRLGSTSAAFLGGLLVGMAARAIGLLVGLVGALKAGNGAPSAFLLAFAATFVPLMCFEIVWFRRASARRSEA